MGGGVSGALHWGSLEGRLACAFGTLQSLLQSPLIQLILRGALGALRSLGRFCAYNTYYIVYRIKISMHKSASVSAEHQEHPRESTG